MTTAVMADPQGPAAISVPDERTICFPRGLLGFEDVKSFTIQRSPGWEPFAKLIAVDSSQLSFVIAPPRVFAPQYVITVDPIEITELETHGADELEIWAIVTIPDDLRLMSVNLQGPVLINRTNARGKQVVLTRCAHSTTHLVFPDAVIPMTA